MCTNRTICALEEDMISQGVFGGRATIHFKSQQTDLLGNAQTSLCPFLGITTCEPQGT